MLQLFISYRCPSDNTYRTYNAPGKAYRFGFETLRFVGDSDLTYLHCGVYICIAESSEPACSKSCNGGQKRKRRSIDSSYGFEYRLQTGPIFLERKKGLLNFVTFTHCLRRNLPTNLQWMVLVLVFEDSKISFYFDILLTAESFQWTSLFHQEISRVLKSFDANDEITRINKP